MPALTLQGLAKKLKEKGVDVDASPKVRHPSLSSGARMAVP
ncbi:hypothetical protein CBM2629_U10017 [Cupriavidus taiwanensis]|nr:hypothetical protein CBM2629_U10017 [Cupriavidus taiwanensis]